MENKPQQKKLLMSVSPHIKSPMTVRRIMLDVVIALTPTLIAAVVFFGFAVFITAVLAVLFCGASELLFHLIKKRDFSKKAVRESSVFDCSFAVTGLLIALNLPVFTTDKSAGFTMSGVFDLGAVNWLQTILITLLASVLAIVIVKMVFGGIGKNFANPAMTARIFVVLTFTTIMTNTNNLMLSGADTVSGATWLGIRTNDYSVNNYNLLDMFLGLKNSAAVGEVCIPALLAGYIYLSVRRVIDFRTPLILIGAFAVFVFFFSGCQIRAVLPHMLSGGLFLGAIFMATDYSSSPNTFLGTVIFAVGIALITALIRIYGTYPEGMSFAIVIMNVVSPLIDKFVVPRPFGKRTRRELKRDTAAAAQTEKGGA